LTLLRESKESVIKMAPNVENALLFSLFSANLNIHPRDPTDQAPGTTARVRRGAVATLLGGGGAQPERMKLKRALWF